MKRFLLAFVMAAAVVARADSFVFSADGQTVGSLPRELPTQGVSLSKGWVVVGLHALDDAGRADCGWYRVVPGTKPVAQSNEVWRVTGYTFTNYTAVAVYTCSWKKVVPKKYSKLSIITELEKLPGAGEDASAWVTVRKAIEARGLMDKWNACTYIEESHAVFAEYKAQIAALAGLTEAEINTILSRCIY